MAPRWPQAEVQSEVELDRYLRTQDSNPFIILQTKSLYVKMFIKMAVKYYSNCFQELNTNIADLFKKLIKEKQLFEAHSIKFISNSKRTKLTQEL